MSGKILIVDDLVTNRIILKVKLNAACHEVLEAADGLAALDLARQAQPQLILLDIGLPGLSGLEVCRRLRSESATRHTPIILISASNRRESRLEALAAGADDFLPKPLNETVLMARIRSLLRLTQAEAELRQRAETCCDFGLAEPVAEFARPPSIALVSADPGQTIGWRRQLGPHLDAAYRLMSGNEALECAAGEAGADIYVMAFDPAAPTVALRLIADLRARSSNRGSGICLAMEPVQPDMAALALDLGADDLAPLPGDPQETAIRLRLLLTRQRRAVAMRRAVVQGLRMAATDPLTGLHNRRYALAQLDRIAARAAQTGQPYAVMVLDIDRFKQVNDCHGHAAGDQVLETVALRLSAALRPADLLARIGGEEFLVVLPDTGQDSAMRVARRLCALVADQPIRLDGSDTVIPVTLSAGLAVGGAAREGDPCASAPLGRFPDPFGAGAPQETPGPRPGQSARGRTAPLAPGDAQAPVRAAPTTGDPQPGRAGTAESAAGQPPSMRGTPPDCGLAGAQTASAPGPEDLPAVLARRLLARADAALLKSKAQGRNRIRIASAA